MTIDWIAIVTALSYVALVAAGWTLLNLAWSVIGLIDAKTAILKAQVKDDQVEQHRQAENYDRR